MPLAARHYTDGMQKGSCAVFSHGLYSSKDGYKITRLAERIISSGADLITFDFFCCGESGSDIAGVSISRETDDLKAVVLYALAGGYERIHLIGSSMGAAVSLLVYESFIKNGNIINSLILIAPPFDLEELILTNTKISSISSLGPEGLTEFGGISIKNFFFAEAAAMSPAKLISRIDIPVLCIHGNNDSIVPYENSVKINRISAAGSRLVLIPDGDHNLTAENHLAIIGDEILQWLQKFQE